LRYFLRAIAECFVRLIAMAWASVCLSVCPSVRLFDALLYCIKMVQARITKSLLWAPPRTLVYHDKISCPWMRGSLRTRASKKGIS